jgi:hypothetical protein
VCGPKVTESTESASVFVLGEMYQEQSTRVMLSYIRVLDLFRARERKDNSVGTIAEPRKGAVWRVILRTV